MMGSSIQSLVRRQIIYYLVEDYEGGEMLMKEVWEECSTDLDKAAAKRELEEIIELLRDRDRRAKEI